MHVGVPSIIALLWVILVSGCAGNEIAPAENRPRQRQGMEQPITALYAAPADVAFITVSDLTADIVGSRTTCRSMPSPLTATGYAAELALVPPFVLALATDRSRRGGAAVQRRLRPRCLLCQRHR